MKEHIDLQKKTRKGASKEGRTRQRKWDRERKTGRNARKAKIDEEKEESRERKKQESQGMSCKEKEKETKGKRRLKEVRDYGMGNRAWKYKYSFLDYFPFHTWKILQIKFQTFPHWEEALYPFNYTLYFYASNIFLLSFSLYTIIFFLVNCVLLNCAVDMNLLCFIVFFLWYQITSINTSLATLCHSNSGIKKFII